MPVMVQEVVGVDRSERISKPVPSLAHIVTFRAPAVDRDLLIMMFEVL